MNAILLVKKAKKGDTDALVNLIMAKKNEYFKLAYVYLNNQEDSLDAIEEMIVIVYENIHQLKKDEAFYSWSKTILVNCCKKLLHNRKNIVPLDKVQDDAFDTIEKKDEELLVEEHLAYLSEKHQEVIRLRYYLGLDYQTIADILKIPLGTVKSRLSVALDKLSHSLGGVYDE